MKKQHPVKDLTGWVSHRLTVVSLAGRTKYGAKWKCRCTCGRTVEVLATHLRTRSTKSCGCIQRGHTAQKKRARRVAIEDAFAPDPLALLDKFRAEIGLA